MSRLAVDVVTDDEALARLAPEWSRLLAATPDWSAFRSYAWVHACRTILRPAARPFVVRVRAGGETVALWPLEREDCGALRFVGEGVTNYHGPVHGDAAIDDVVDAVAGFVADDRRVTLLDLRGLREDAPLLRALLALRLPGWTTPRAVRTAICPYVALGGGWSAVAGQRSGRGRAALARKWRLLERLGRVEFMEATTPEDVRALLPSLFTLFRERWADRHESGGFADRNRTFHEHALPALAAAGLVRLSAIRLDGEPIAFAYGLRGAWGTTSYVLGHANALNPHSPGLLLLTRMLEAASARGDREYDFSLGEEPYKASWATGARGVFRVVAARRRSTARVRGDLRRVGAEIRVAARSIPWLRSIRREGVRRFLRGPLPLDAQADAPGLAAGRARRWTVYRVARGHEPDDARSEPWTYGRMRGALSPRLLHLAADRSFRGDVLLAVHRGGRLLGIVWRAGDGRRDAVSGGSADGAAAVYYHPVVAAGAAVADVVGALPGKSPFVVVTPATLTGDVVPLRTFTADHRFRGEPGGHEPTPVASAPRPG